MTFALLMAAALPAGPLGPGSPVPALRVATYVRGKAVDLSKGVHVVEFWATWCGPCKLSIPRLTDLARRYGGRADFTGVSVWENGPDQLGQVRRFVAGMGSRMAYNVAWEGSEKAASSAWLDAAAQDGIPAAFVVRDGRILWIGSPLDGLEGVVDRVVSGTFDLDAAKREAARLAAEKAKLEEEQATYRRLLQPVRAFEDGKDFAGALQSLDRLAAEHPDLRLRLEPTRFVLLVKSGSPEQLAFARHLTTESYRDRGGILAALAWSVVAPDNGLSKPDVDAALVLSERAVRLLPEDCNVLATHARVLFVRGERAKAVEVQGRAVQKARLDPRVGEQGLGPFRRQLEHYRGS